MRIQAIRKDREYLFGWWGEIDRGLKKTNTAASAEVEKP